MPRSRQGRGVQRASPRECDADAGEYFVHAEVLGDVVGIGVEAANLRVLCRAAHVMA
jgi:hypothetical protein